MQQALEGSPANNTSSGKVVLNTPRLIFSTELDAVPLQHILEQDQVLDELARQHYGLALAMHDLSDERARIIHTLNTRGIYTVAWLLLPPEEGCWFHVQNYPQAVEYYRAFHAWAARHYLHFDAVGLDIAPPDGTLSTGTIQPYHRGILTLAQRLWMARENALYAAARAAYLDLIAEIHHDGYEVHTYQLPLIADDRRAGTTLLQRAMDVIDLPSDVEVLMCTNNSFPFSTGQSTHNDPADMGGSLIASYGTSADGIGIGSTLRGRAAGQAAGEYPEPLSALSWPTLKRDILLAAQYTDTIYLFTLEGCVAQGLLPHIAAMDWTREPETPSRQRVELEMLRSTLLVMLFLFRHNRALLAWLGWGIAIALLLQRLRRWNKERSTKP